MVIKNEEGLVTCKYTIEQGVGELIIIEEQRKYGADFAVITDPFTLEGLLKRIKAENGTIMPPNSAKLPAMQHVIEL